MQINGNSKWWMGAAIVLLVALLGSAAVLYVRHQRAASQCAFCSRPLNPRSRAVAVNGGDRELACCPTCVLSRRAQTGKKLRLVSVTDYDTGAELKPEEASYVVASNVSTCEEHGDHVSESKQPLAKHLDRCSPSILAFAKRERAEQFAREQGGNVGTLAELGMR